MNEDSATDERGDATPIFGAYRRGYDPDQVDRYVNDQQRRLDEAIHRASEAERKLAAAVGQLRELHRRVAVLESEERSVQHAPAQAQPLDTLGERVQRILQEAWEGAYAVRQSVEEEIAGQRTSALTEAKEIVSSARRKAQAIEEEIERRRQAYIERLEEDRARAVVQITHLKDQRSTALAELVRVRDAVVSAVSEVDGRVQPERVDEFEDTGPVEETSVDEPEEVVAARVADNELPRTMPVHRFEGISAPPEHPERADLVRSHREAVRFTPSAMAQRPIESRPAVRQAQATVFDFDQA